MDSDVAVPHPEVGHDLDMTVRLVGLQFRRQNFCLVWKLVAARAVPSLAGMTFVDSGDEHEAEEDAPSDEELLRPSADDVAAIVSDLDRRLGVFEGEAASRAKACKALRQRLARLRDKKRGSDACFSLKELDSLADDVAALADGNW